MRMMSRGAVLAVLALVCGGNALAAPAPAPAGPVREEVAVQATPERRATIAVQAPARPKGVVLFSHGASASWANYPQLFARLNAAGYAVLAPLHVDSKQHPDAAKYDLASAFFERVADMGAAAELAEARFPGLPVAAMGHSYGSLAAQMQGGALKAMTDARVPAVKAVVSFSSPGSLSGLIQPSAFSTIAVPTLMVTGTADVVPNFVTDWRDHLRSHREAPAGDHYLLTIEGGDHFVAAARNPAHFERAARAAILFLDAHLLADADARRKLAAAGLERR